MIDKFLPTTHVRFNQLARAQAAAAACCCWGLLVAEACSLLLRSTLLLAAGCCWRRALFVRAVESNGSHRRQYKNKSKNKK